MERTLKEILNETGINRSTFQKYKTMGLLPRPIRIEMLKGYGSVAYYPDNIGRLIRWIREWQADGETLKQIKEKLEEMQDVTPDEEILIPVDSDDQGDFVKNYANAIDEIHRRLDPDNPVLKDFWVRFEPTEIDGKKYYKIVSALSCVKK